MSTALTLQIPNILEVNKSVIRISHPDITGNTRTTLAAQIAAAGTAMSVLDNNGFTDNDWFIIGEPGDSETEENDVNGAVTRGQSVTVTNTLKFAHELDAPVTKINERKITIYGSATDGGALVAIVATGAAVDIDWNNEFTEYVLATGGTEYAYYVAKFYDGVVESDASDYILASGLGSNSVEYFIQQSLALTNAVIDSNTLTRELMVKWANDAQTAISQYIYQDPQSGKFIQTDWDFELATTDDDDLVVVENVNEYSITGLNFKYPASDKGVISVRMGDEALLARISYEEYQDMMTGKTKTTNTVEATAGDTTLTVGSNVVFNDTGTLYIGADIITYTGKSSTTGFTGVPASGDGAITSTHAVGSAVWQGISPDKPEQYTVYNGTLYLDRPPKEKYEDYPIYIKYFEDLTALTDPTDTTDVTFTNVFQYYLASKISDRQGSPEKAAYFMKQFNDTLVANALRNKVPVSDEMVYYTYSIDQ